MAKIVKKLREVFSPKQHPVRFVFLIIVLFFLGFAALGVTSIQVWQYSNSNAFCAKTCHDVHPEEPVAFGDSHHAQIKCVECHMGRLGTLKTMFIKAGHLKHVPAVIFGAYHRPVTSESYRTSSDSCERCHTATALHGDSVKQVIRYQPDEANSEKRTYLILKIGGSDPVKGLDSGVHWHVVNPVEYIATDESKQEIRWVRATLMGGEVVEFNDAENPLSAEEIGKAEIHSLECMDCHNRMGHPFLFPEKSVDEALASGRLSRDLPFIKKEMFALLSAEYASQEDALAAVDSFKSRYTASYPAAASQSEAVDQAEKLARELIVQLVFEKPGITWESFPDNRGHKQFPGCFRCHDDNHVSTDGRSIRLNCDTCHNIPVTVSGDDLPPLMSIVKPEQPEFHGESSFLFDHRLLANESCTTCHGEISFGRDDSGFCATSVCHGESWPRVDLDRGFEHPLALVGKHEEALCYTCHKGIEKPASDCMSCHSPPANHVRGDCTACHEPKGWKQSAAPIVARSKKIPHALKGMEACLMCHDPGGKMKPAPADHRRYNANQCVLCHRSAGNV